MAYGFLKTTFINALRALFRPAHRFTLPKSANLDEAADLAYCSLLSEIIPLPEVLEKASQLFNGPMRYSTHDLALSVALAFFKDPANLDRLRDAQLAARVTLRHWLEEKQVINGLLAASFEDVLYKRYKHVPSRPEFPEQDPETTPSVDASAPKPVAEEPALRRQINELMQWEAHRTYLQNYTAWAEFVTKAAIDPGIDEWAAAAHSSVYAKYFRGQWYELNGGPGNNSARCFKEAADAGFPDARAKLIGLRIDEYLVNLSSQGDGDDDTDDTADRLGSCAEQLITLRKAGCIEAHYQIARLSRNDGLFEKNDDLIRGYLRRAAKAGHLTAQVELGCMYRNEERFADAEELLCKASRSSHVDALRELAALYLQWHRKTDNQECARRSFELFNRASEMGDTHSTLSLAGLFESGIGTTKNLARARALLSLLKNTDEAQLKLGRMCRDGLGGNVDYAKAIEAYLRAAQNSDAAYELGLLYLRRDLPHHNVRNAIECFGKASDEKSNALTQLGLLYLKGEVVRQNVDMALEYLHRAATLGDAEAIEFFSRPDFGRRFSRDDIQEPRRSIGVRKPAPADAVPASKQHLPQRYVVLDFETTGFAANRNDRVIEIGAVEIVEGRIGRQFQMFVNPEMRIPRRSSEIHRITDFDIAEAPKASEAFPALIEFIGDAIVVAHNIRFELEFLQSECGRLGIRPSFRTECTLETARRLYPNLPSYKLGELLKRFNIVPDGDLHRALPDARCTAELLLMMMNHDNRGHLH